MELCLAEDANGSHDGENSNIREVGVKARRE
jgi:hypothetical protein